VGSAVKGRAQRLDAPTRFLPVSTGVPGSAYADRQETRQMPWEEGTMMHLLGQALFGLVVGALAKLIMPGQDPGGWIITMLLGLVGSMVGTFVGRALWGGADYSAGWITSILGAIVLLAIYRAVKKRQTV
jgi:uncharacterized membrane protein YeaQ/YmgE (transglycosylase-associated protein family)